MIPNAYNLETVCLSDCPKGRQSVLAECENAQRYIEQITALVEGRATSLPGSLPEQLDSYSTALLRLRDDLERAIAPITKGPITKGPITKGSNTCNCDNSEECVSSERFEQDLLAASDIRWLCNQCDYYFSLSIPLVNGRRSKQMRSPQQRKQWQIRAVRRALGYLRMIAMIRRLL